MTAAGAEVIRLSAEGAGAETRSLAVEAPVAVEVNGLGYAVMMMTPADLYRFALGFLLTERLIDAPADLLDAEVAETAAGLVLRATVAAHCAERIVDRVRHRSSDTGCGLCGIAGLEQLRRPVAGVPPLPQAGRGAIFAALAAIRDHQPLGRATGAVHAAAWVDDDGGVRRAFEDVGRHNALDKLVGWAAAEGIGGGFVLVTSRVSFEMVDKALVARAPMLVGISAATTLAVDHAKAHGLTLVAVARPDAVLVMNDPGGRLAPLPGAAG